MSRTLDNAIRVFADAVAEGDWDKAERWAAIAMSLAADADRLYGVTVEEGRP